VVTATMIISYRGWNLAIGEPQNGTGYGKGCTVVIQTPGNRQDFFSPPVVVPNFSFPHLSPFRLNIPL